jgi:hypothetical protein
MTAGSETRNAAGAVAIAMDSWMSCLMKVSEPPPERRLEDDVQMKEGLVDIATDVAAGRGEGDCAVVTGK